MFRRRSDAGVLLQRTRGDDDYDASNHCDDGGTSADRRDDNNNDAPHGWRLLIRKAGAAVMVPAVLVAASWGVCPVKAPLS